jgi:hypothetical protein
LGCVGLSSPSAGWMALERRCGRIIGNIACSLRAASRPTWREIGSETRNLKRHSAVTRFQAFIDWTRCYQESAVGTKAVDVVPSRDEVEAETGCRGVWK